MYLDEYGNPVQDTELSPQSAAPTASSGGSTPYTFDDAGLARLRQEHPDYAQILDGYLNYGYQPRDVMGMVLGPNQQPRALNELSLPSSTNGAQTAVDGYGATSSRGRYSGGDYGDFGAGLDPFYTQPFDQQFTPPADSALPTFQGADPFSYQDFQAPAPFQAPTGSSILSDPSYQFRLDQGRGALEASAAGRGVLNSGGTLKDLLGYGQNFASQEYQNVFNRDLSQYNEGFNQKLAAYGANRGNAADAYKTNYQTQHVDPFTFGTDRANTSFDRGFKTFQDQRNQYYANQNQGFDKLFKLSDLGLRAASV